MADKSKHTITSMRDLKPDSHNANRGTERGAGMLEASLREYGAGRSLLVDKHGVVIAGNKTLEAAASIGLERVRVIETDGTELVVVQRTDLDLETDARAKALGVADNRISEVSLDWDANVLAELTATDVDLSRLFSEHELATIVGETPEAPAAFPEYDENIKTDYRCPKCGYTWSGKKNADE
jgi:hypothetical protein